MLCGDAYPRAGGHFRSLVSSAGVWVCKQGSLKGSEDKFNSLEVMSSGILEKVFEACLNFTLLSSRQPQGDMISSAAL